MMLSAAQSVSDLKQKKSDRSSFVIHTEITESERRQVFFKKSEISPTCYVTAARFRVKNLKSKFYYPRGPPGSTLDIES